MKHFTKVGGTFDTSSIEAELKKQPLLWGKSPRVMFPGSPHQDTQDIILRGPIGQEYKTLQELHQELQCEDYPASEMFPKTMVTVLNLGWLLSPIEMRNLGEPLRLGRVIFTKLPPGKAIQPHRDEGPVPQFYRRFHLVIEGGPSNIFMINGQVTPMESGEVWDCDVREMHTVINLMDRDRIHLIADIER